MSHNLDITSYFRVIDDLNCHIQNLFEIWIFKFKFCYLKTKAYIKILRYGFGDISLGNRMVQLNLIYNYNICWHFFIYVTTD
jgi:hypothetical protein